MKYILGCFGGHTWLEPDGGQKFQDLHIGCGQRISSSSPIKPEEEKDIFYCHICKSPEIAHYNTEIKNRLIKNQTCFDCDFWQEKIQWRMENKSGCFIVKGHHYKVEPDCDPTDRNGIRWSGHGGSKFIIKPENGPEIVTRNLWHQGEVPARFRDVLTDNAVFVNP